MADPEVRLARWLKVTGVAYATGAVDYLARPHAVTRTLSAFGEPLEDEAPGVYNSLAAAYMATIATLALTAAADPEDRKNLIPPLLVAKATSSAALLLRYVRSRRTGFAVAAGIDAFLFGVTAGLYANIR